MTVEQSIGTPAELECVGYNITKVMQVITAEAGNDEELCRACTQALANATQQLGGRCTPDQVVELYRYAYPVDWISDEAYEAVVDVFLRGETYEEILGATLFYNPLFGVSDYHEQQNFIVEINGVRFYEEVA